MNWITNYVRPRINSIFSRRETPENLWSKCTECGTMLFHRELSDNLNVCTNCGHHMAITPRDRFTALFDGGIFVEIDVPTPIADPLQFKDQKKYPERMKAAQKKTGEAEAMLVADGIKLVKLWLDISREEQDLFAHNSHQKALSAQREGRFDAEIAPYDTGDGVVEKDGCIKNTSMKKMAMLKPAFLKGGTVTAATASPFTDGSAAVLVCGEAFLKRHDLKPLARIVSFAVSGCEPGKMGLGPIESSRKALKRAGMTIADMGVIEMNEAFASQAEASRRALDIDPDILNVDGGAIALGHPLGATGARLVGKCATLLHRENKRYGLATQCMGGGMGIAMVLEAA